MWHGQIEPLGKAGYKVIIWDMRGHGRSAYPEDQSAYSEKHTVADMVALLDQVAGSKNSAVVGGLSLGGYMSLAFYRDHPERVEALLIIGRSTPLHVRLFGIHPDVQQILARASRTTELGTNGTKTPMPPPIDLTKKVSRSYRR